MLENWLIPQLNEDSNDYIFQQDGSPAHYHKDVRGYLNRILPLSWIGRKGKEEDALMQWPPRSPDLTSWDFFFWRFVKDIVFVPALPANLQDLRNLITAAVTLVDRDILTRVWNEMDYRIDVCRITKREHIEHLYVKKLGEFLSLSA
jgi:hypothetical protein